MGKKKIDFKAKPGFRSSTDIKTVPLNDGMSSSAFLLAKRGFQITFSNHYTISVQFGKYNYCSARDNSLICPHPSKDELESWAKDICEDAEVAVFDGDGNFVRINGNNDDVIGYVTPDKLMELMLWVSRLC